MVVDEDEIFGLALELPLFAESGLAQPVLWPRVTATLISARCRKLLARHRLRLDELFSGPAAITEKVAAATVAGTTEERIDSLRADLDAKLNELADLVPPEDRFRAGVEDSRRRMIYQLGKMKSRLLAAEQRRSREVARQITRLCGELAPWGRLQEKEIAGIQFVARYSASLTQMLYERTDIWNFEHQNVFP
jgi:uncharacterized protein YllA (UPF0747 family)